MENLKKTVLILAGGRGTRFWPKSRKNYPKQFLSLTGDGKTMIQITVERLLPLVQLEDIYISTNKDYRDIVKQQLPNLPEENILCEPVGKNTAPCIGLGAVHISKKYDDAIMMVLTSDHAIKMPDIFLDTLSKGCEVAAQGKNIVTIGITPNYPETGYGYIKYDKAEKIIDSYKVDSFKEKPDLETAKQYLATGEYLWNAGEFIWKVSTILNNMQMYIPDTYTKLMEIKNAIGTDHYDDVLFEKFSSMNKESIDYAILENASDIFVSPGNYGWDDVGSWLAVERLQPKNEEGNVIDGDVICINTKNSIIQGGSKLIATVGIDDLVIVDTPDALLVASKEHCGEIKEVMAKLEKKGRESLL